MKLLTLLFFISLCSFGQKSSYTHGTDIIENKTNHKLFIVSEINTNDAKKLKLYCKEFQVDTSDQKIFGKQIITGDTIVINPNSSIKKGWAYMYQKDSLMHDLNLQASITTLKIIVDAKHCISVNSSKYHKKGCLRLTITNKMLNLNGDKKVMR